MNVSSFCSTDIVTAEATDTLQEAAETMARSHVGALVVLDNGELAGVISEADVITAIAEDANLASTAVEDYMTEDPVSVQPEDDAALAARRMVENGIGYLLVIRGGSPVGVVSRGDLLSAGAAART
ncbi:MAG TPA: CBS domain-containing protein [Candidatus Dormibacteraeota bacterium]|nr:CBS domain-containing protein [Candidatus Dormibacteraeota bacterium]